VGDVAEHERQVEHVELVDDRADRPDGDAGQRQRPHLGLLDHLLLAAELHRREHLDGEPAVRRLLEFLAHADHGLDGRVAERVHVARLEHHLLLGAGAGQRAQAERERAGERQPRSAVHSIPPSGTPLLVGAVIDLGAESALCG
jgi:hypothetical protein